MIRSKFDSMQEKRGRIRGRLERALATKRGTAEARAEAQKLQHAALQTNTCQACGGPLLAHPRQSTYCRSCQARIDRMHNFKSKLKREMPKSRALQRFIEDYTAIAHLPYSLRGVEPKEDIIKYASGLLRATLELEEQLKDALAWRGEHANLTDSDTEIHEGNNNEEIV